ncbi:hypothetical protein DPMN_026822 [Dreissena polymorpha]|uniref:Uncharacterized protein n=1 Tax=Dreissena polymorpha TaxID=45954 RepID=A0A9D4REP6_DREPO|nr:hypothetical protein DPMN_026822 [Dreissena polymorpha]
MLMYCRKRLITGLSMKFESKEALMISQAEQTLAGLTVASPDQMIKQITSLTAAEVNAVSIAVFISLVVSRLHENEPSVPQTSI